MATAKALYFAAELEIASDVVVIENTEAVDDGNGAAGHGDHRIRVEGKVSLVADGQNDGVHTFEGGGQVLLNPTVLEFILVPEEARPGMARRGVIVLLLQLQPLLHVGVVDDNFSTHFRELSHHDLRAAVAGVPHILPVGGAEDGDPGGCYDLAHVPEGISDELCRVEGAGVVNVDGERGDLEDVVIKAHESMVGPDAQAPILGQAVAADPRAGKDHVGMGGADLDGLNDLDDIHAVALREEAPFVEEGKDCGPVGVLHDLAGLAFYRAVQDSKGELLYVQDFGEELHDLFFCRLIDSAADPPEVADGGDVFAAGHYSFVGVG